MSHVPHALIYAGLCSLPLLIWLPLWLWCDDDPRNQEEPGDGSEDGRDPAPDALPAAA
jgi:hypothetical protein